MTDTCNRCTRPIGANKITECAEPYSLECFAVAHFTAEIATLRADLARVTGEREEATVALEGVSNALGGLELYELSETAGHVETVVADRDEALADLARVTEERDEARAKVAGLTLSPLAIQCIRRALDDASNDYANSYSDIDASIVFDMDRYVEALGVRS